MQQLRNRAGYVSGKHQCELCAQAVLQRTFLLFPCTHAFHVDCVSREVGLFLARPENQVLRDRVLERGLHGPAEDPMMRQVREQKLLEAHASEECCLCGPTMVASVRDPFVDQEKDAMEIESWQI